MNELTLIPSVPPAPHQGTCSSMRRSLLLAGLSLSAFLSIAAPVSLDDGFQVGFHQAWADSEGGGHGGEGGGGSDGGGNDGDHDGGGDNDHDDGNANDHDDGDAEDHDDGDAEDHDAGDAGDHDDGDVEDEDDLMLSDDGTPDQGTGDN